ncbi:MAG: SDR family oxidoreductase [Gammaproteobacteria bacterium]|nr:SDR family oxidoreductase [Gammaproteobacteria bacterium]NNM14973.1 SDR family oxidoreductase [Gammaproteobacteria bacterium]
MSTALFPDLKNKVVFITGGGSGIGAGMVRAFAQQGAKPAFVSLSEDPADALCDSVEQETGIRPLYIQCDITDLDALKTAITQVQSQLGPIGILINNAARDLRHDLIDYSPADWDKAMHTNLRPHFFTAQAVIEDMRALGGGSIINLGSNAALLGLAGYASYVTAKAGIIGLSKALARELGPDNIRVNTLIPGWVMTARQKELWVTPEAIEQCLSEQSLKRSIEVQDVTQPALFLASQASAMITGQMLIVDGGRV